MIRIMRPKNLILYHLIGRIFLINIKKVYFFIVTRPLKIGVIL